MHQYVTCRQENPLSKKKKTENAEEEGVTLQDGAAHADQMHESARIHSEVSSTQNVVFLRCPSRKQSKKSSSHCGCWCVFLLGSASFKTLLVCVQRFWTELSVICDYFALGGLMIFLKYFSIFCLKPSGCKNSVYFSSSVELT